MHRLTRGAILAASLLFVAAPLASCANLAATAANIASDFSSQTPSQVADLADAVNAATIVTQTADVYVKSGAATTAQLNEIRTLSDALHVALTDLEAAQAQGKSLDYAAFNAALAAYNSYATSQAIAH